VIVVNFSLTAGANGDNMKQNLTTSQRKAISDRMKKNNPMKNPEIAKKVGLKHKGNIPWWIQRGLQHFNKTPTMKKKLSKAHTGKILSKEHRKNIGTAIKGKTYEERYGLEKAQQVKNEKSKRMSGARNPNWNKGSSFEPYGIAFTKKLKTQIKQRDQYRCQECFKHESELYTNKGKKDYLHIHHIDFNKKNNALNNLISLCRLCHKQTYYDRKNWIAYYQKKMLGMTK